MKGQELTHNMSSLPRKNNFNEKVIAMLPYILLACIILAISAYMVYWGTQKEAFHMDEMFSVMDIRGKGIDRPYKEDGFYDIWHTSSDLESTIRVAADNAFTGVRTARSLYQQTVFCVLAKLIVKNKVALPIYDCTV